MIDRVLRHTAHPRPHAHPARPAGLAYADILMIKVAYLADGCHALGADDAYFPRVQPKGGIFTFTRQKLHGSPGASRQLAACSLLELHIMDDGTHGDRGHRERIPRLDVGLGARQHGIAHLKAERCDDIALLSISVMEESDARRSIRIVLNLRHFRGDADFIAPEVDHPVFFLVPAAPVTNRYLAAVVSSTALADLHDQRFLRRAARHFFERRGGLEPSSRRRRVIGLYRHLCTLKYIDLFTRLQRHVRFLPVGPPAQPRPDPLFLARILYRSDIGDLDLENAFDSLFHLHLVGVDFYFKGQDVVFFLKPGALLGYSRHPDDIVEIGHHLPYTSCMAFRASCVVLRYRYFSRS